MDSILEVGIQSGNKKNKAIDYVAIESEIAKFVAIGEQEGKLPEAVESLLNLEKQMRLAADIPGTRMVVTAVLDLCFKMSNWKKLNEQIVVISKRRAQLKQVVTDMVRHAMRNFLLSSPNEDEKVTLIKTLISVTAGKIFVELERARLTRLLSSIQEEKGRVSEAAETLQQVAVETFGAMSKAEKISFILEQVRLCLDHGDFIKAHILSKKINPRVFTRADAVVKGEGEEEEEEEEEGDDFSRASLSGAEGAGKKKRIAGEKKGEKKKSEAKGKVENEGDGRKAEKDDSFLSFPIPPLSELKLSYYNLMIRYYKHMGEYLEIVRCYQSIFESRSVANKREKWVPVLQCMCWYLVLSSPDDPMQSSLLHATLREGKLSDLPEYKSLLLRFSTLEIIHWDSLLREYEGELKAHSGTVFPPFSDPTKNESSMEEDKTGEEGEKEGGNLRNPLEDLKLRVIQHNILVVAKYYSRISLSRLSSLLHLSDEEAEKQVAEMVVTKALPFARIDRVSRILTLSHSSSLPSSSSSSTPAVAGVGSGKADSDALLNGWSGNIQRLLDLVEGSCHQIHKETMLMALAGSSS